MSKPLYVGIDNGASGAVALVRDSAIVSMFLLPVTKYKGRSELVPKQFITLLQRHLKAAGTDQPRFILIEQPGGSKSAKSATVMAGVFHAIRAILDIYLYRWDRITPQKWQGEMLGKNLEAGMTKPMALETASRLWPKEKFYPTPRCHTPDLGLVDAALIAEYARRQKY